MYKRMCVCLCACENECNNNNKTSSKCKSPKLVVEKEEEIEEGVESIEMFDNEDYVYVDVQGFKTTGNTFIIKEFCLLDGDYEFHTLVKSPCTFNELPEAYKREANWLTIAHHGLRFDSGHTTLTELVSQTAEHVHGKKIMVKGVEKCKWVRKIYENLDLECVNVEDSMTSSPSTFCYEVAVKQNSDIANICPYHRMIVLKNRNGGCNCALSHARQLRDFYVELRENTRQHTASVHHNENEENINNINLNTTTTTTNNEI